MQHGLLLFGISHDFHGRYGGGGYHQDVAQLKSTADPVDADRFMTYFTLSHVSGCQICFRTTSELDSDVSLTAVLKYLETGHQKIILIRNK